MFRAGDALSAIVTVAGLRVALMICYDLEFPEAARTLALRGAELLLVPTALMRPNDAVATRLVPTRAMENQDLRRPTRTASARKPT